MLHDRDARTSDGDDWNYTAYNRQVLGDVADAFADKRMVTAIYGDAHCGFELKGICRTHNADGLWSAAAAKAVLGGSVKDSEERATSLQRIVKN